MTHPADNFSFLLFMNHHLAIFIFFFFNDTATTEIYTLSLHDALPIFVCIDARLSAMKNEREVCPHRVIVPIDRKSTRLNSSHLVISYAVFCLKKKKTTTQQTLAHTHEIRHQRNHNPPQ